MLPVGESLSWWTCYMIAAELLALLICPETRQELSLASAQEVDELNEAIRQRTMRTVVGKEVEQSIDGALIRDDRTVAYPIRDGIPVMLVAEGLAITPATFRVGAKA